ncbi:hypothetical protein PR202_gb11253 [Eleusine coracana subsp. coracana]|uniref:Plastid lipid-associated protein/fibrillin conserved domain-containing protein n=1 Tax=Eleusine coracana subsp. coracana TaxID=191504 RepID=A0AAV5EK58_ELECO|nr:hypothetical protein PR202_gb11253 [Eleusine coracana subsp. coracana]
MAPAASLPLLISPGPSAASSSCQFPVSPLSLGGARRGPSLALAAAPAPGGRQDSRWRAGVSSFSFLPPFLKGEGESDDKKAEKLKEELLAAIAPLDRGAEASPEDKEGVEQVVRQLEAVNKVKEPLKSDLLNGKWELLYTTSTSILQPQVTANLVPLNAKRVAVKFDYFKIFSLIPIKAPGSGKGELEITYLDEELRISRGDKGNLFVLKMVDPTYRVPLSTE